MSTNASQARVLVVEDEASLRASIVDLLSFSGYDVTEARNAFLALQYAESEPPDLIITDVMMPEMDGYQLVKCLRSHPATSEVPIILLSGQTSPSLIEEGLRIGANKFIKKPFGLDDFLKCVDDFLGLQ